jgi:hypothetical protein
VRPRQLDRARAGVHLERPAVRVDAGRRSAQDLGLRVQDVDQRSRDRVRRTGGQLVQPDPLDEVRPRVDDGDVHVVPLLAEE